MVPLILQGSAEPAATSRSASRTRAGGGRRSAQHFVLFPSQAQHFACFLPVAGAAFRAPLSVATARGRPVRPRFSCPASRRLLPSGIPIVSRVTVRPRPAPSSTGHAPGALAERAARWPPTPPEPSGALPPAARPTTSPPAAVPLGARRPGRVATVLVLVTVLALFPGAAVTACPPAAAAASAAPVFGAAVRHPRADAGLGRHRHGRRVRLHGGHPRLW